jgi:fibronectin-binding autotransporter adhesin
LGSRTSTGPATGTLNLNGGTLTITTTGTGITGGSGTSTVNFNGTTLKAGASTANWIEGLTTANIQAGGALLDTNGFNVSVAQAFSGTGGLSKLSSGTLTLTGSNGFTGATSITGGILSFGTTTALQGTSGVSIAGGAGLTYTGTTAAFGKNITVTSGTGTVRNTGGGSLTLSGTLTKNGTVLRLNGGAFNVTGQIVGANPNSDLLVDAAAVTLSNTNSYNGPTFVINSGTLTLGVNNAIPNNSIVTLGDAASVGTLQLNGFTDAIGGLAFGTGGGTLRLSATSTSAAPLTAVSGTMTLTNGTLDLAGSGSTAGLYRVLSAQSVSGSFANVTGASAAYRVITSSTSVDYQQRAVISSLTVTSPTAAIITGGSAAFTYSVANSAQAGGATLSFTGSGTSNVAGSSSGSAAAGNGSSGSISGLFFTGTSVGSGQLGTFTVSDPQAFGTTATGTVSVTVLDHATSSLGLTSLASPLTSTTVSLGQWNYATSTWESGGSNGLFTIYNLASTFGAEFTADLALLSATGTANGFSTNLNTFTDIVGGTSSQYSIFANTAGWNTSGLQTATFVLSMGDKVGMSGATTSNTLSITAQVIVVPEPAAIALAGIGAALAGCMAWRRHRSAR